jgi:hypothetical protein
MFNPILWPADGKYRGNPFNKAGEVDQDVREVWFNGFHCDVGGGLPEADSGLAKVPLKWMIEQTEAMGLAYVMRNVKTMVMGEGGVNTSGTPYVAPDGGARMHETMTPLWAILEFLPRRKPPLSRRPAIFGITIPFFERRNIPERARLHASVVARMNDPETRPRNAPSDFSVEV